MKNNQSNINKKPHLVIDMDTAVVPWLSERNIRKHLNIKTAQQLNVIDDFDIYRIAQQKDRHIVTGNFDDFYNYPKTSKDVGIIGYKQPLSAVETKLKDYLRGSTHKDFYGKSIMVTQRSITIKRECK